MIYGPSRTKRFELRLYPEDIERWRAQAAEHGVPVAEMIRHAMEYAAQHMPTGYIQRVEAERFEALCATFGVRTESVTVADGCDSVRTVEPASANVADSVRTDGVDE